MYPTYTWRARNVPLGLAAGNPVPMSTKALLFNAAPNCVMDILRSDVLCLMGSAGADSFTVRQYMIAKVTGAVGGYPIVAVTQDSANPLPAQVVGSANPDSVSGAAIIRRCVVATAGCASSASGTGAPQRLVNKSQSNLFDADPIRLNEGEGLAIVSADGSDNFGGAGPLIIEVAVADVATGVVSIFQGEYVGLGNGPAMCVINGSGSGVVLAVMHVSVICTALSPTSALAVAAMYFADVSPSASNDVTADVTADIVAHDSAKLLPQGISAWIGEMGIMSRAGGVLQTIGSLYTPQGMNSPAEEIGPYPGSFKRLALSKGRRFDVGLFPAYGTAPTPTCRNPISIECGRGVALGVMPRGIGTTVYYAASSGGLGYVADVEITFRVRPRTARRIIGATSIRGVT